MNKPYFCRNFFLADWRHKRLKNTIDLLLLYREHFYGFSESVLCMYFNIDISNVRQRRNNVVIFYADMNKVGKRRNNVV